MTRPRADNSGRRERLLGRLARCLGSVRLPSFRVAYTVCSATLVGFVVWIVIDAQFYATWRFATVQPFPVVLNPGKPFSFRVLIFYALSAVAIFSLVGVLTRMFVGGDRWARTLRGWFLAVLLMAGWMGLVTSYERLDWWALQHRAPWSLPRFKLAAEPLLREWPTQSGSLPEAGTFQANPLTLALTDHRDYLPLSETFGGVIAKAEGGGLRFTLRNRENCWIEWHPPGIVPVPDVVEPVRASSLTTTYHRILIDEVVTLDDGWYLVRYKSVAVVVAI